MLHLGSSFLPKTQVEFVCQRREVMIKITVVKKTKCGWSAFHEKAILLSFTNVLCSWGNSRQIVARVIYNDRYVQLAHTNLSSWANPGLQNGGLWRGGVLRRVRNCLTIIIIIILNNHSQPHYEVRNIAPENIWNLTVLASVLSNLKSTFTFSSSLACITVFAALPVMCT